MRTLTNKFGALPIFLFFILLIILPSPALAQPEPLEKPFEVWVTNQQKDSIQIIDGHGPRRLFFCKRNVTGKANSTTLPQASRVTLSPKATPLSVN